ncbi:MAG TPA: TfoX/Sxy family protein [bacterium]|nr:TfoX/Sxy family protein [bacterium]
MPANTRRQMPKWTKAPPELVARFAALLEGVPDTQTRKMFGYPAALVRGHLFAGVFQEDMFVRLSADDCAQFMKIPGARPFEPMPGRAMRGYVVVPPPVLASPRVRGWLEKAVAHAKSLPRKARARQKR